ncbi:MAG: stage III sporulation protein AA [Ruminococcaceae bacterium]|nr:stage III sporulation protein AA [Oscillospiraceae bacterium]
MNEVKSKNRVISAALPLVPIVRNTLSSLPEATLATLREIRLRVSRPLCLVFGETFKYIAKNGCLVDTTQNQSVVICSEQMINDAFKNICGYSVYSHINEITSGFITMPYGHRAGICGTAVMSEGKIINIRDISSISIRISREVIDAASDISMRFYKSFGGVLICGAPSSGKTTILRDMARLLSTRYSMLVSVVDSRNELSGTYKGKPQNDLGYSDVLVSYPRLKGIEHALRSLSPQVIVCDEIGSSSDAEALLSAVNSGVRFIASIHAANPEELKKRKYAREILETKAFSAIAFLSGSQSPGRISRIMSVEDVCRV